MVCCEPHVHAHLIRSREGRGGRGRGEEEVGGEGHDVSSQQGGRLQKCWSSLSRDVPIMEPWGPAMVHCLLCQGPGAPNGRIANPECDFVLPK